MLKHWGERVLCFDAEWIPDAPTIRRRYGLPAEMGDNEVVQHAYERARKPGDDPHAKPYLKTALCRIVCICGVYVDFSRQFAAVRQWCRSESEARVILPFLDRVTQDRVQLVGFNSKGADLPAIVQRAIANGLRAEPAAKFCARPDKPWEGIDYWDRYGHHHVDLIDVLGGFGKSTPSLDEICAACSIPTKAERGEVSGASVAHLWETPEGQAKVVRYCTEDALRVWGLYARIRRLAGLTELPAWGKTVDGTPGWVSGWRDEYAPIQAFEETA